MSRPAPSAGANTRRRSMLEPSALFLGCTLFFRAGRYAAVIINSATTRVSTEQANAANRADEKLIRTATFPNGTSDARCARMTQRGTPGGCATPRPSATRINSPLSVRVTVGASVQLNSRSAMRNTAPAQSGSALDEGILAASTCRFGFDAGLAEERREGFAERFMRAGYEARLQEGKLPFTRDDCE